MHRLEKILLTACAILCLLAIVPIASAETAPGAAVEAAVDGKAPAVEVSQEVEAPSPAPASTPSPVEAEITQAQLLEALGLDSPLRENKMGHECALDFDCTMACQATQHACIMGCGLNVPCQHACMAAGEQCAYANCCL